MSVSWALSEELASTTMHSFVKNELIDVRAYPLPLLDAMERGKQEVLDGGTHKIIIPIDVDDHSGMTQLATGYENINLGVQDVGQPGEDETGLWVTPVVIGPRETRRNRGKAAQIDILQARTKNALHAFRRNFHKRLWGTQDGTYDEAFTDLNTLNGDDYSDGFLESAAVGAQSNSVHGLSKSTYNQIGWNHQYAAVGGAFGTAGLAALQLVTVQKDSIRMSNNGEWFGSVSAMANLKRALNSNERYVDAKKLDGGRLALEWNGEKMTVCRDLPNSGTVTGQSNQEWSFVYLDLDTIKFRPEKGDYFSTGKFREIPGTLDVRYAPIVLGGQLLATYLGNHVLIRGADTYS